MKKTYLNPTLTVVNVKPSNLLQVSGEFGEGQKSATVAAGRKGSFSGWNEEEE